MFVVLALMALGALLVLLAATPDHGGSLLEQHGALGALVAGAGYVLWLCDHKNAGVYFGLVFGASAALIDPSRIYLGCAGLAFTAGARYLQVKLRIT